jgi:hypothetical protein
MTGDALRREADQHDRNASVILSAGSPSYEDAECAAREVEQAKDKRALADCLDFARERNARHPGLRKAIRRFKARLGTECRSP